ncbi:DUF2461 domain-containing protein [Shimia ponticola]|uniref:DUF2461 domain-containing protein n=1 Tax=Shimia ponticola TaxID=2582893 RepID=UPI00164BB323|nr:DUF2461 domain-containing protein [Shimia ponticola]
MADDFAQLIPDARDFYTRLAANNSKDWWTAHKTEYESRLKRPALLFLDVIADHLRQVTDTSIQTKLFRPHRDVRFSKDKTPYHTHLHMLWSMGDDAPGYFLGLSHTYLRIGAGRMGFEKDTLLRYRAAIDEGGPLLDAIDDAENKGYTPHEPALKRVPSPFDKDHPRADLLRQKACSYWSDIAWDTDDLTEATKAAFSDLTPLTQALRSL